MLFSRTNTVLDALPQPGVRIGSRVLSPYAACASVGYAVGILTVIVLAAGTSRPIGIGLALAALALAVFLLVSWARRAVAGKECYVQLELVIAIGATSWGALTVAEIEPGPWLDILAVAALTGCGIGRLGCASYGCCYGVTAEVGIAYPPWAPGGCARRFPVQVIESICYAVLAAAAATLTLVARPGAATTVVLGAWGLLRFSTDAFRDDPRPRFLGQSESRWLACAMMAAALIADVRAHSWSARTLSFVGLGICLALILVLTRRSWFDGGTSADVATLQGLRDFGARCASAVPGPQAMATTVGDLTVEASWIRRGPGCWLVLGATTESMTIERARLYFAELAHGLGATGEPTVTLLGPHSASAEFQVMDSRWDSPGPAVRALQPRWNHFRPQDGAPLEESS
jgi:hypothetical protein